MQEVMGMDRELSLAQANLKLAIWHGEAESTRSSELYLKIQKLGLPREVAIRLHELMSFTKEAGGRAIAVGKIVLIEILKFIEKHPFLVAGAGIGAILGASIAGLITSVPLLGQLLTPVAATLGLAIAGTGATIGHRLDKEFPEVGEELVDITKHFFSPLVEVFNLIFHQVAAPQKRSASQKRNEQASEKKKLLDTLDRLGNNPRDRVGILASMGVTTMGAAGAGAGAAVIGAKVVSIPILTAITGATKFVAAPIGLVAGVAVAGGIVAYCASVLIRNAGFQEGRLTEILEQLQEKLEELEAKERKETLSDADKTEFKLFLRPLLEADLVFPQDAQQLMQRVEKGQIPLKQAYRLLEQILLAKQKN